jgi:two-component system sensor histidine kinase UhpB
MPILIRVLILEDRQTDAELMVEELRLGGFEPQWQRVETEADYLASLVPELSVILADFNLPAFDAARALRLLNERKLEIPFIVVSGTIGEEVAVAIMREGAADYLLKDRLARLPAAVTAVLENERLRRERRDAETARRGAEQRYREIFENAIEGICQTTMQGRVVTANPAMARILGYSSPQELIGAMQHFGEKLHADDRRDYDRLILENDSVRGFECQLYRTDGGTIWVSLNTQLVRNGSAEDHYDITLSDITELKETGAALNQYRKELQDLAARLLSAQETESKRLARELHDVFSQKLAVLSMELGTLRKRPPDSHRELQERLAKACEQISELAKAFHQTSRRLHPAVLYDLGLSEALKHECAAFARQHEIRVTCSSRNLPAGIPDEVALCLYRVAQESLRNIRHHAKAGNVRVALKGGEGEIVLTIDDDGCGFVRQTVRGKGGLGLVSMEERVRYVGGTLFITSTPGRGTRVQVRAPSVPGACVRL